MVTKPDKGTVPIALLIVGIIIAAVLFVAPSRANIPPTNAPKGSQATTECEYYTAQTRMDRIQQWVRTLQSGLIKNPGLAQEVWTCVQDMQKILVTDQFVYNVCSDDPNAPFEPVVFKALEQHLDQCGISIER